MTLIERIKIDQLTSRKDRNSPLASLLTTLIGEAEMVGKNKRNGAPTDKEVQSVITKFMQGNAHILNLFHANENCCIVAEFENNILMSYRPGQLSHEELVEAIVKYAKVIGAQGPRDMGRIMKGLKEKYDGQYDGKTASTLVKEHLSK